jgi:hypothetical protein
MLGHQIDAPLVNDFLVYASRSQHDLPGKSGNPPNIKVAYTDMGVEGHSVFYPDRIEQHIKPSVVWEQNLGGEASVSVSGSLERVQEILRGMLRKSPEKLGFTSLGDDQLEGTLEHLLQLAETKTFETIQCQVCVDLNAIHKGLAKIALGVGHILLGEEWTFSSSADVLRSVFLRGGAPQEEAPPLPAFGVPPELREKFVGSEAWPEGAHFVAVLPFDNELLFIVSLFGSDALTIAFDTPMAQRPHSQTASFGAAIALPINEPNFHYTSGLDFAWIKGRFPEHAIKSLKSVLPS